jgi:hypothetical protein
MLSLWRMVRPFRGLFKRHVVRIPASILFWKGSTPDDA